MLTNTNLSGVGVRWATQSDLPVMLQIEQESNPFPLTEADFFAVMQCRQPHGNCFLAEPETLDRVLGLLLVSLHEDRVHIESLSVARAYWRCGVGTALVLQTAKLLRRQAWHQRDRVTTLVSEVDMDRLLFFRRFGFKAIRLERGRRDNQGLDRVVMELRI